MSKIGINELAAVLAGKHGLEQAKAEIFVRQVFDVINDGLRNEKLAKIKGDICKCQKECGCKYR